MIYLALYAALLLGGLLTYGRPGVRRPFYILTLIGLFVFVAFRFEVGCDWSGYINIFELQRYVSFENTILRTEPAFWLTNALLHSFGLDYPYINVVAATLFFAGFHALARRQPDPLGFLMLAFPVLIIGMPMSALRQAIAIGFLCVAYNAFVDRRLVRYVILVIGAASFHASAMTFMMLAPIVLGEFTRQKVALAVVLALPGVYYLLGTESFGSYAGLYFGGLHDAVGGPFRAGMLALTGVVFLRFLNARWKTHSIRDHKLVLIGSYLMIAMFPIAFLSSVTSDRFGYYLTPLQFIILARLPHLFSRRDAGRFFIAAPYAASAIVLLVWTEFSRLFNFCYLPYLSWLFMEVVPTDRLHY